MDEARKQAATARRVVVKVGSAVLTSSNGLEETRVDRLAKDAAGLIREGRQVLIVSSGAVSAGAGRLGMRGHPHRIIEKQAAAAVGQSLLVQAWESGFARFGLRTAQVLLDADDLTDRKRYLNARHTLITLLEWGVIPIINENDTVMTDELQLGDNDHLAVLIATMIGADLLVLLSEVDALYDRDPRTYPQARRIPWVRSVDAQVQAMAAGAPSAGGSGGMQSKLRAAAKALDAGLPLWLAHGGRDQILSDILLGSDLGTLFAGRAPRRNLRKAWLAQLPRSFGELIIDAGAVHALQEEGRSLLAVGVRGVRGEFGVGSPVRCTSTSGRGVGIGLVNYASADLLRIAGHRSHEIEALLGFSHADEVIHRDNFALLEEVELLSWEKDARYGKNGN